MVNRQCRGGVLDLCPRRNTRASEGAEGLRGRRDVEIDDEAEEALRRQAKAVLRKRARALRNTIPADALAARSARIVESVAGLPIVAAAERVALFWPIVERHEVDLRPLDA